MINKLNGLDLVGYRLVVDLLSNQAEAIINLFEQLCSTTTTVTSSTKNDPRLANAGPAQTSQLPPPSLPGAMTMNEPASTTSGNNTESRESISNAVASLPPAQVRSTRR